MVRTLLPGARSALYPEIATVEVGSSLVGANEVGHVFRVGRGRGRQQPGRRR